MILTTHDRTIINHLQGGFPTCEDPWDELATILNLPIDEIICRIDRLQEHGMLSRFGPIYNAERMGGGLTLAAIEVPETRYDEVTDIVNSFDEVAHNYARDHKLNMWFVLATERPEQITSVIDEIEQQTGLQVYNMPKQEEYFLQLKFEV
ncbi:MAG: Lrp/AsnC family transcriptional regulator [Gammaproteobacteria bacterium]|nr:Lrp/AsnC family transcriptional regulator [Gammaproteobacteria bacterium]